MKLTRIHLVVGVALLGALAVSYFRTNHIVFSEHERFDRSLRRVQQFEATLNEDVLKARFGLLDDYDGFPIQIEEIKKAIGEAKRVPSFVSEAQRQTIQDKVDELLRLVSQKEELLETFKSQNAVLNNSLRYFPVAATALARHTNDHEFATLANELTRQTLAYGLHATDDQAQTIARTLEKANAWRSRHRGEADATALGSLTMHANSIMVRKAKVEALTRQMVSMPTGPRAEESLRLYEADFARALRSAELFRVILLVSCGLLVLGIGYTIYALHVANTHLEQRVQERTRDLSRKNDELQNEIAERQKAESQVEVLHRDLIETSRQAGMAEVATSVLHNVGNVLNSVNVSCSVVAENVKNSRAAKLSKVVALFREHDGRLSEFFSSDSRGQKLPGYLAELTERLGEERAGALSELTQLQKNIDHIKEIVAMQQSFAKVSGVTETVKLAELVEDAIKLNLTALTRHDVEVVRDFHDVPPVSVDKHKLLQILVNLICNAKQACRDLESADHKVTIGVRNGGDTVRICVSDNGVGIAPENLTRIFSHGFTTKKTGHGFGLHSGALAARELGGALRAHSDGLGQGATFTIELPLEATAYLNE